MAKVKLPVGKFFYAKYQLLLGSQLASMTHANNLCKQKLFSV